MLFLSCVLPFFELRFPLLTYCAIPACLLDLWASVLNIPFPLLAFKHNIELRLFVAHLLDATFGSSIKMFQMLYFHSEP